MKQRWPSVVRGLIRCGATSSGDKAVALNIAEKNGFKKITKLLTKERSAEEEPIRRLEYGRLAADD